MIKTNQFIYKLALCNAANSIETVLLGFQRPGQVFQRHAALVNHAFEIMRYLAPDHSWYNKMSFGRLLLTMLPTTLMLLSLLEQYRVHLYIYNYLVIFWQ